MCVVTFFLVRGVALSNCRSWAERRSESLEDEPLLLPLAAPEKTIGVYNYKYLRTQDDRVYIHILSTLIFYLYIALNGLPHRSNPLLPCRSAWLLQSNPISSAVRLFVLKAQGFRAARASNRPPLLFSNL